METCIRFMAKWGKVGGEKAGPGRGSKANVS